MNDDLTRMVLNPDVTVRSRGVIEKCSFCVQRLQAAKLEAKKDARPMVDADVKVACQQACPTHAISFGNANDKKSAITVVRAENPNRNFTVLEQLHVLPNVTYLAKVRNDNAKAEGHAAAGHETKSEGHEAAGHKAETKKAEAAH
jgi:molybdopterin-containing oxidoreductase family iron-sulfur binding subunit